MVVQSIGLVTDLRNQNKNISSIFVVAGAVTEGDADGGVFWWNPSSTVPDDSINNIQVTGVAVGRWERIFDTYAGVPASRTLTINGVTYDLSANRSWTVGGLTGSGANNQVAFWTGATNLSGSNNFLWDNSLSTLTVNGLTTISASPATSGNVVVFKNNNTSGEVSSVIGLDTTAITAVADIRLGSSNPNGIRMYASDSTLTVTPAGAGFQFFKNTHPIFPGTVFFDSGADNNASIIFRTAQTSGIITERMRIFSSGGVGINQPTDSGYLLDVNGTTRINGVTTIGVINAATIDTDRFIVSDGGVIKYRTGAQILSDIGAQGSITLTTTGTSGVATLIGNTLNIPNYSSALSGYVPTSRTITINGISHDLSSNRSWSVGTVTSVDMSVPTGFSVTGNPVTGAGTLNLSFTSGYSLPTNIRQGLWDDAYTWVSNFPTQTGNAGKFLTTDGNSLSWASNPLGTVTSVSFTTGTTGTDINSSITNATTTPAITLNIPTASATNRGALSSADWSTFNSKQDAITLTTTGSSGAATLIGSTLNIPIYSSSLTGYVPYTGATQNVNLGEWGITAGYAGFDLTPTGTPTTAGTMSWDDGEGTVNLVLKGGNVNLPIGAAEVVMCYNDTASTMTKGQIVYIKGAQGNRVAVGLADNTSDTTSSVTFGMVSETIAAGAEGLVTISGKVPKLNTTGLTAGAALWLGATPGTYTQTKPTAPNHTVLIGYVERVDNTVGSIFIKVQNGYELQELHNVYIVTTPADNSVLSYEASSSLYKMKSIPTLLGYTPANQNTTLTINGTSYDLSANRTWSVGTVTSIATSAPLTGGTITSSGTIGITQATTSTDGYLSSTDWNTFNNKQNALTNPVTGTGTTNYISKFTGTSAIGDSTIFDNGSGVGIGTTSLTGYDLRVSANITGATVSNAIASDGVIQSDVTNQARLFTSQANTQDAAFTLGSLYHYAAFQGTFGASSTVGIQYGYFVSSGLTGATTNYGFYSNLAVSGTTRWNMYMNGTAPNYLAGSLGIGSTGILGYTNLAIQKNITGNTVANGVWVGSTVQSGVTTRAEYYGTAAATQATTFTLSSLFHYRADQATFGAGSTVTTQIGFGVTSSLIGATNNYAFRGLIPSGTGRWNLYMDGTASNHINGTLLVGTTTDNTIDKLQVTGSVSVSSNVTSNATSGAASFIASGSGTQGGASYLDFIKATNTSVGATNPNKTFRINSTGGVEIVNSAYSSVIFTLTDAGAAILPSSVTASSFIKSGGTSSQILAADGSVITAGTNITISGGIISSSGGGGGLTGTLTTSYIPKAASASSLSDSIIYDSGTSIGVNTASPSASALLHLSSTTKGLLPPVMTSDQMKAISSPANGLIIYKSDGYQGLYQYIEDEWQPLLMNNEAIVYNGNQGANSIQAPFTNQNGGTGAGILNNAFPNNFKTHPAQYQTGTTSTGYAGLYTSQNTGLNTQGKLCFRAIIRTPSALSDATDTYTITIGNGVLPSNGYGQGTFGFSYKFDVNGGDWTAFMSNSATTVDTNIAVAANTKYVLEIEYISSTSIKFYIDNTLVATISSSVPSSSASSYMFGAGINKSAGVNTRAIAIGSIFGRKVKL